MIEPGTTEIDDAEETSTAAEKQRRRFGRRCWRGGWSLFAGTLILVLGVALASENGDLESDAGRLFGQLLLITMMLAALGLVIVGGVERLARPSRARQRIADAETQEIRAAIRQLAADVDERYRNQAGLVGALPGRMEELTRTISERLAGIEASIEKVPAVSEAFLAGMTLRSKVDDDERS